MAQGVTFQCSEVECEDHSTIQAPRSTFKMIDELMTGTNLMSVSAMTVKDLDR